MDEERNVTTFSVTLNGDNINFFRVSEWEGREEESWKGRRVDGKDWRERMEGSVEGMSWREGRKEGRGVGRRKVKEKEWRVGNEGIEGREGR